MRTFAFHWSASFLPLVVTFTMAVALGCTSAGPATSGDGQQAASAPSRDAAPNSDAVSADAPPVQDEVASANDEPAADAVVAADSAPATPPAETEDAAEPTGAAETAATAVADAQPVAREAAKPVVESYAEGVPPVLLSAGHAALCNVMVGDVLPTIELPALDGGATVRLDSLAGKQATVVVFWTADRWMSESALRDLAAMKQGEDVAMVGVATKIAADAAGNLLAKAGATFPQLLDADGAALALVGKDALPRIYVLDAEGRIAWFDLEYSEATRRELAQTVAALTK